VTSPTSYTSSTTSTSSISGLISGMDTSAIVTQLMQINAQPQTLLKAQLVTVQSQGVAYRDVNSAFASLATAAQALTKPATWQSVTATSSASSVSASASSGALPGTVAFTVDRLSSNHSMISSSSQKWATATTAWTDGDLTLTPKDATKSPIVISPTDLDGDGVISLSDAAAAINKQAAGYTATAVNTGSGYQLQITSNSTGAANTFTLGTANGTTSFGILTQGVDAQITLGAGGANPATITSATNTFSGVMAGTTFTVSQTTGTTPVTVSVTSDPDAVASAVQKMVDAANTALSKIAQNTDSSTGSTAPLKGDWSLISLANQVLSAVSSAVGSSSAGSNGLQLTSTGQLTFDPAAFKSALAANPALVQSVFGGAVGVGTDNVANTPDDTIDTDGIAARLQTLADQASDNVSGSLTTLANGEDTTAKNLKDQISAWDLRLQAQQATLTAQFNSMESALGTLKSQSSWLSSQISSLYNPNASKS
jgi:flagellar hook-associated protein 2